MSMDYWSVSGIGVNIEELFVKRMLNPHKVLDLLGTKIKGMEKASKDELWEEMDWVTDVSDLVCELTSKGSENFSNLLIEASTGNMDRGVFILYSPNYPWNMSDFEESLSMKDVEDELVRLLSLVMDEDESDLRALIQEVYEPGCG